MGKDESQSPRREAPESPIFYTMPRMEKRRGGFRANWRSLDATEPSPSVRADSEATILSAARFCGVALRDGRAVLAEHRIPHPVQTVLDHARVPANDLQGPLSSGLAGALHGGARSAAQVPTQHLPKPGEGRNREREKTKKPAFMRVFRFNQWAALEPNSLQIPRENRGSAPRALQSALQSGLKLTRTRRNLRHCSPVWRRRGTG